MVAPFPDASLPTGGGCRRALRGQQCEDDIISAPAAYGEREPFSGSLLQEHQLVRPLTLPMPKLQRYRNGSPETYRENLFCGIVILDWRRQRG